VLSQFLHQIFQRVGIKQNFAPNNLLAHHPFTASEKFLASDSAPRLAEFKPI